MCVVKTKMAFVEWLFGVIFTGIHRYVWDQIHVGHFLGREVPPRKIKGNSPKRSVHAWIISLYKDWMTKPPAKATGKKVSDNTK